MSKSNYITYLLIVFVGVFLTMNASEFAPSSFDWTFLIIFVLYLIISTILQILIVQAFVDKNRVVISSRLRMNDAYEKLEINHKWEEYRSLYLVRSQTISLFEAYGYYAYIDESRNYKRDNVKLSVEQFRDLFLIKNLKEQLKSEKIKLKFRRKILKLQKLQDDTSGVDLARINYKRGNYIGSSYLNHYKTLFAIFAQIISLGIGIYSIFHFSFDINKSLVYKLSIILIIFIADIYLTIINIRSEIKHWNDNANKICEKVDIIFSNKQDPFLRSFPYLYFHSKKRNNK